VTAAANLPRLEVGGAPLIEVVRWARSTLLQGAEAFELDVLDPDAVGDAAWDDAGEGGAPPAGAPGRSWRAWVDLADELALTVTTPTPLPGGRVRVRFRTLGPEAAWHGPTAGPRAERYAGAAFAAVRKLEEPGFLLPLLDALTRARPPDGGRVLVLGCNRGDEIAALGLLEPPPRDVTVIGVDHAAGPLREAERRFPGARFLLVDLHDLPAEIGRVDLVVAIGVLQSPAVDDRRLLRQLVQEHLLARSALVLGVPNSRFRERGVRWGARTRNVAERDLSLVVKDLAAYRRYLHQHGFRTHIGGRYDLLLVATRTGAGGGLLRDSSP
jgi:SAM-dependent methyltransferase